MTAFTELAGCRLPLQLAGMGGVGAVDLAAAVARAGGLGMLPVLGAEPIEARVRATLAAAGDGAVVGANILMPFLPLQVDSIEAAVDAGARVVEFFYGDPDPSLARRVHDTGALAAWQVGSVDEARAAAEAGCDLVVVQGVEAGGHVRGSVPLLDLLRDAVADDLGVPIVASGGITTPAHIAEVLDAGADGVRMGTRFVATREADAHPGYVDAVLAARSGDTVLTTEFGAGWPDAPHRVLASALEAARHLPPEAPARFSPSPPDRAFQGRVDAAALYAGTGVGEIDAIEEAGALAARLMAEAQRLRNTRG